jgi:hypothetical protein
MLSPYKNNGHSRRRLWPFAPIVGTASFFMPSRAAVAGAISAALSQVDRVNGRAISNSPAVVRKAPVANERVGTEQHA